jgi:ribosomal protein L7/L12
MPKIKITGWRIGFNKIAAVGQIQAATLAGLKNSKDYVDKVAGGETVTIEINDFEKAQELTASLRGIGAEVEVME